MSYVSTSLLNNEKVTAIAEIHWFVFFLGSLLITIGLFPVLLTGDLGVINLAFLSTGFISLIKASIIYLTTELAITDKRIITKVGFIARRTIELNLLKVESLSVHQSIAGRILGFGTVTLNGTGGIKAPFKFISKPLELRRALNETLDTLK